VRNNRAVSTLVTRSVRPRGRVRQIASHARQAESRAYFGCQRRVRGNIASASRPSYSQWKGAISERGLEIAFQKNAGDFFSLLLGFGSKVLM